MTAATDIWYVCPGFKLCKVIIFSVDLKACSSLVKIFVAFTIYEYSPNLSNLWNTISMQEVGSLMSLAAVIFVGGVISI